MSGVRRTWPELQARSLGTQASAALLKREYRADGLGSCKFHALQDLMLPLERTGLHWTYIIRKTEDRTYKRMLGKGHALDCRPNLGIANCPKRPGLSGSLCVFKRL